MSGDLGSNAAFDRASEAVKRSEEKVRAIIDKEFATAEATMASALAAQHAAAEKMMLGSGAALALLATLATTEAASIPKTDFAAPAICFIVTLVLSGVSIWTRIVTNLKLTHVHSVRAVQLQWLKDAIEKQHRDGMIGKIPAPTMPEPPKFPERWMSAMDILLAASGTSLVSGVIWATANFLF